MFLTYLHTFMARYCEYFFKTNWTRYKLILHKQAQFLPKS